MCKTSKPSPGKNCESCKRELAPPPNKETELQRNKKKGGVPILVPQPLPRNPIEVGRNVGLLGSVSPSHRCPAPLLSQTFFLFVFVYKNKTKMTVSPFCFSTTTTPTVVCQKGKKKGEAAKNSFLFSRSVCHRSVL